MAKTLNPDIDLFKTLSSAKKAFEKETSADLLEAGKDPKFRFWFVDRSKTAFDAWPQRYLKLKTK